MLYPFSFQNEFNVGLIIRLLYKLVQSTSFVSMNDHKARKLIILVYRLIDRLTYMAYSFLLRPHQGRALFPVARHLCPYPANGHTGKQAADQEMGRR